MKIFRKKSFRIWMIVTAIILVLLIVLNILVSTSMYTLVCTVLGSKRRVSTSGEEVTYYESDYTDKDDALEKSNQINKSIVSEGITLLKNDNNALPLAEGSKISVFGKNSVNLVYGGSGSSSNDTSGAKTIFDSLTAAGFSYNPSLKSFYEDSKSSGSGRASNPTDLDNGEDATLYTGETPQSSYTDTVKESYSDYNDAAIIVISRIGGEGFDLPRTMQGVDGARQDDDHFLQLDQNEADLIQAVCSSSANFRHVIIVINSANAMELGFLDDSSHYAYHSKIDACLWMAGTGNYGVMALGELLKGKTADGEEISPSGRLTDTYARNFKKDPTWNNFGTNLQANGDRYNVDGKNKQYYFVEYEEGIYVGYRYYETRGYTESLAGNDGWYSENVVFPFGYGLSYTEFDSTITNKDELEGTEIESDTTLNFTFEVTNTGDWSGKEVLQLYVTTPYTDGGIEKSHMVLVGFAKTDLLAAGENSGKIEISVDAYDLASYDYNDANGNGFKGYELEAGDYQFKLCSDSHTVTDSVTCTVKKDITYATDPDTGTAVVNIYDDADDNLSTVLSRTDWEGTWPTTPDDQDRSVSSEFISAIQSTDSGNDEVYDEMPVTGAETDLKLIDMMGKDYNDEGWEELLDSLSVNDMLKMFNYGAFNSSDISSIGKPLTIDADGPSGFTNFMDSPSVHDTCVYCSEVVLGATWNVDLAYAMGASIGNEGILGYSDGDGTPYSGIYAPGVNIHRSPFGGRNNEYMSEDGYLTGIMAASEIQGAASRGVYMFVKHFALNEQETHRSSNGLCTWATEQAIREIYLKPFEKAVKEGKTTAVMSSFNRIGTRWTGGDYRLLTQILRNEWGFEGTVITDFNTNSYMDLKQMAYAGGDLNLATVLYSSWNFDQSSAADVSVLRRATKNVLYTVANSNAMNMADSSYIMPLWQEILYISDGVVAAVLIAWGIFVFVGYKKSCKNAVSDR